MEALKGVRILDMTHVQAGPTCSQLLAWMGADVIKFENPQGDATRGQLRDVPNADSLYFTMLNSNKRSLAINTKSPEGLEVMEKLIDVVGEHHTKPAVEIAQAITRAVEVHRNGFPPNDDTTVVVVKIE